MVIFHIKIYLISFLWCVLRVAAFFVLNHQFSTVQVAAREGLLGQGCWLGSVVLNKPEASVLAVHFLWQFDVLYGSVMLEQLFHVIFGSLESQVLNY